MRIGHYQLACKPEDFAHNAKRVLAHARKAGERGMDIVSFPESFLTGYYTDPKRAWANSFSLTDEPIKDMLQQAKDIAATWMVGLNEKRGGELYNSVIVIERGEILGVYAKAFPCYDYFTPGRDFPVFERDGVKFGVVICADGGYIEPTRILAFKGARIIFAPHYNYIGMAGLIDHFVKVRFDHAARAVENGVWFLRGNNVVFGRDEALESDGHGYGDSYLLNPNGEVISRSQRGVECFINADLFVDEWPERVSRSKISADALGAQTLEAANQYKQEMEKV